MEKVTVSKKQIVEGVSGFCVASTVSIAIGTLLPPGVGLLTTAMYKVGTALIGNAVARVVTKETVKTIEEVVPLD